MISSATTSILTLTFEWSINSKTFVSLQFIQPPCVTEDLDVSHGFLKSINAFSTAKDTSSFS